jgi:hypothetical protein
VKPVSNRATTSVRSWPSLVRYGSDTCVADEQIRKRLQHRNTRIVLGENPALSFRRPDVPPFDQHLGSQNGTRAKFEKGTARIRDTGKL